MRRISNSYFDGDDFMKCIKRNLLKMLCAVLACFLAFSAEAQNLTDISFQNQSLRDILQVLGGIAGYTILPDETVEGRASFVSPSLSPRKALELFLEQERLYGSWDDDVLRVSRVSIKVDDGGHVSLDAENVKAQELMAVIARESPISVVYDALPPITLDIHAEALPIHEILALVMLRIPEYVLEEHDNYFYVRLSRTDQSVVTPGFLGTRAVNRENDLYTINVEHGSFRDVLDQLFRIADTEYSYLSQSDRVLNRVQFKSRTFEEILKLLTEQAYTDFVKVGNLYYIYDIRQSDILAKYKSSIYRQLEFLDVKKVQQLIPPEIAPSGVMKIDAESNALILYGTLASLEPLQNFLDLIDQSQDGRKWERYNLDYLDPSGLQALLPAELSMINITAIPQTSSIIVSITDTQKEMFDAFLKVADKLVEGTAIALRYIKSEDLLAHIPPSFDKNDIAKTQDPSLIFFNGTKEKLAAFKRILETMDRPVPQIRYDLLVLSYQDSQGFNWEAGASYDPRANVDSTSFSGTISPLLSLGFDIASTFGYQFALKLSASLEESQTKVVADTTLNGLSGEKISFRNTNTYRYRDYRIDPATGDQVSEGSREITSGLFIDVEGWVSGDNMITMDIATTISKQQGASSSSSDVLPPTTERVVDTHVRTPAGTPVIISGLTQQDTVITEEKVPVLGDIPLLGLLFKKKKESQEDTELVIYIVPHIEYDRNDAVDQGGLFERIYVKYIQEP